MLRRETCSFLRRLSGLLSGYLPTDTRPQARAKLGNSRNNLFERAVKRFFAAKLRFVPTLERISKSSLKPEARAPLCGRIRARRRDVNQRQKKAPSHQ